jgi:hypothetical protein
MTLARCLPAVVVLSMAQAGAEGQRATPATAGAGRCAPIAAARGAANTFGHEGGSLRPRTIANAADGRVRAGGDSASDSLTAIAPAAVAALARLARTGGFWTLRPPPVRRPPRNPDAARRYIAVALTCGTHRVEYVMGDPVPAAFTEFEALLGALAGATPGR